MNDSKIVFYATDKTTKTLIKKARNSLYKKDIVFVRFYNGLENKKLLREKVPLNTPFVEEKQDITRTKLYSFSRSFQALQADISYICFLATLAVDPKSCLLFVDLFTSKIYTYPMKKRKILAKKWNYFIKT